MVDTLLCNFSSGHEPAPTEGETLDDEQQGRSITEVDGREIGETAVKP